MGFPQSDTPSKGGGGSWGPTKEGSQGRSLNRNGERTLISLSTDLGVGGQRVRKKKQAAEGRPSNKVIFGRVGVERAW